MGQLFDEIRQLVTEERYIVGQHASERLEERNIMEWQVVAGIEEGTLIAEHPNPRALARWYGNKGRLVPFAAEWCRKTSNRTFFR